MVDTVLLYISRNPVKLKRNNDFLRKLENRVCVSGPTGFILRCCLRDVFYPRTFPPPTYNENRLQLINASAIGANESSQWYSGE